MKLSFKTRDPIKDYHRAMIAEHGEKSSLALGWLTHEDQLRRFAALSDIADLNGRTVLDAGCGYADLYQFLKQRYPKLAGYYGLEQLPEMVRIAQKRYPEIKVKKRDFMKDQLPVCDYVLGSGSLNYGQDIKKAITRLYQHCKIGLGFNLLKTVEPGILKAHDAEEIFAFAKTLSPRVLLKDDYAPDDFTLFLFTEQG